MNTLMHHLKLLFNWQIKIRHDQLKIKENVKALLNRLTISTQINKLPKSLL